MTPEILATLYAGLTVLPIAMQLSLTAGAPLGRFAAGGRFPGRMPPAWRALALVQAGILAGMAWAVLDRAGVVGPGLPAPAFWLALALSALTFIANAASPSRPERLLWTPVTALMTAAALGVAAL